MRKRSQRQPGVRERPLCLKGRLYLLRAWDGRGRGEAAEEEVERELAEMNVSLEQLTGLEEKEEEESGSSVHGSETCLREY